MDESDFVDSSSWIINGEEVNGTEIEEFYENIEAPKFMDLNSPDLYQPGDDRSWFCSRAGCDHNHEEEMDSETIYKNFVLRVMAARSPNIGLRRALCRKNSGVDAKCPRTVPAKPSKSRITRMALISSMSKSIVDTKVKVKPLSKQNATPKVKAKQALTTPEVVPSVRNQKTTDNEGSNSRAVAKTLVFGWPKKGATPKVKAKQALTTPEVVPSVRNQKTTDNEGSNSRAVAKTLVFGWPKKGEMNKPLKNLSAGVKKLETTSRKKQVLGYDKPLPSRKQFRRREVKSRVFDGLLSQKDKVQPAKSSRCLEKNRKANNLLKNQDPVRGERVEKDVNETETEEKTTNISPEVCSITSCGDEISRPPSDEKCLSDASRIDSNSSEFQPPGEIIEQDDKGKEREAMESDDKENALASDHNRESGVKTIHIEHKILSKHEIPKRNQKTTIAKRKQSKENSAAPAFNAQSLKLKKPKPTNPKPFRLRTDERGIFKEATLETKLRPTRPLCEIPAVPKLTALASFEKHHYALLRDAKYTEKNQNHDRRRLDQQPQNRSLGMGQKTTRTPTPQRHTICSKQKLVASQQTSTTPKSDNTLRRSKLPSLRQVSRGSQMSSSMLKTGQLGTIKETSSTVIKGRAAIKARENGGASSLATKASVCPAASRRSKTIPYEPKRVA
ncbi:uncharacterized protein [Euphorbia lathyris]|uniref:uncharacterized protein n=1 Tax=Euphorbia lathyris TaxID=212925 RepID=UPI003313D96F